MYDNAHEHENEISSHKIKGKSSTSLLAGPLIGLLALATISAIVLGLIPLYLNSKYIIK